MKRHLIKALLPLVVLSSLPSCANFTKQDAAEYATITAEQALVLAQARLDAEAAKPGADPLKIAALQTAVLLAQRALEKAKADTEATAVMDLTSSK
ncbi:MAG: hypothetical protein OJI67_17445 [Prosthecobacter sp.]|nr:hypothetical protein [Prosthecobacter sp.]